MVFHAIYKTMGAQGKDTGKMDAVQIPVRRRLLQRLRGAERLRCPVGFPGKARTSEMPALI